MIKYKRIFLVGHPGAGKALVGKQLAEEIGWNFVDADLGLESRVGYSMHDILMKGEDSFYQCQNDILSAICNRDKVVVTTDASVVCSDNIRKLLASEFTVYLKVSTDVQMERTSPQAEFLLPDTDRKTFFKKLHDARDHFYEDVSCLQINSDNSALDQHVATIIKEFFNESFVPEKKELESGDLIFFHKTTHTPVQLSWQQANCLKYLAQGQSAKEIAREMQLSFRTVEGTIARTIELLGCQSSKELIVLYHSRP